MVKLSILITAVVLAFAAPARADNVGAVIGGSVGMVMAGPPGAIIGVIIGGVFGRPWWGPDESYRKCWIDNNFRRHCPRFPLN